MSDIAGGKVSILVDPDFTGFPGKLQAGLAGVSSTASSAGKAIGTAIVAGTAIAAVGFKQVLDVGIQYQNNLNQIQAVTGATGQQMAQVGATAQALGSDLSLPATSAADAAQAMLELSKGGLSVDQAMTAAKGTLQLAAAAQIDGGRAAEIQTNALNAFGLSADQAGHVADVLANTANQASGEITDFAAAFQSGGAVAHQFGVSIEDTSTALGLFANAGIKGSDAGTLLKSMLLGLVNQSKPAQAALKELGVNAFDAQGKFVGLPAIFDQLRAAAARMTPEQYAAATATTFGSDAARAAGIAAQTSRGQWDQMAAAVNKAGGASEVAAAKTKGLGGAIEGFKSQLETVELQLYSKIAPALEQFVRAGAEGLPKLAEGAGTLFSKLSPIGDGFRSIFTALAPIGSGIAAIVSSGSGLSLVGTAAQLLGDALKVVATVISPLASVVGGLLNVFSQLPGPIQSAVSALLLLRVAPGLFTGLVSGLQKTKGESDGASKAVGLFGKGVQTLTSPVRTVVTGLTSAGTAVRGFGEQMKLQQSLASASGQEISKLGAAHAAFATSSNSAVTAVRNFSTSLNQIKTGAAAAGTPISTLQAGLRAFGEQSTTISKIGTAFTTAASGAQRFGTLAGTAAAVGKTVQLGLSGLVGFLGGPWGVALAAAGVALGLLGQHQEEAAQKARDHQAALAALSGTLDQNTGAVTQATVAAKAKELAENGSLDKVKQLGISTADYTQAMLGNQPAIQRVTQQLQAHTAQVIASSGGYQALQPTLQAAGISLNDVAAAANGSAPAMDKLNAAIQQAGAGDLVATQRLEQFKQQMLQSAEGSSKLAQELGISTGELQKMQHNIQLAAEAGGNFQTKLDAIKPGLAGIQVGVQPTAQMSAGLHSMAQSAQEAAQRAGESAASLNGVAAGGQAAYQSMAQSRQAFIDTAVAAGANQQAAEAMANSLGLIPDAVRTQFTSNAPEASVTVDQLIAKFNAVPGTKQIVVQSLTQDAQSKLIALGYQVTQLPNGQVMITAEDSGARLKLDALKTMANTLTGIMQVDANIAPGTAKGQQLQAAINGIIGIITVDANPAPGTDKANQLKSFIDTATGIMTADANTAPGTDKANQLKGLIDSLRGMVPVDANTSAAEAQVNAMIANFRSKSITIPVMIAPGRAAGSLDIKRYARGGTHLTPMSGGKGRVVKPNTWRVIGDNPRYDELFLPLNKRSKRSQMLLKLGADRMGYDLVKRYAEGGLALNRAIALTRRASASRIDLGPLAAYLRTMEDQLTQMRQQVVVNAQVYNPLPEKVSESVNRRMRTLSALGAFGPKG